MVRTVYGETNVMSYSSSENNKKPKTQILYSNGPGLKGSPVPFQTDGSKCKYSIDN